MGIDSNAIGLLMFIVIIGFGLFLIIKAVMKLKGYLTAKKEFIEKNKHKVEIHQDFIKWCALYFLVVLLGIVGLIAEINGKQDMFMIAAYIFLYLYVIAFWFEVFMRRCIIFEEDGFFYAGEVYRFKSIRSVERMKGIIPRYEARLTTQSELIFFPKKYALLVMEKMEIKKRKKKLR